MYMIEDHLKEIQYRVASVVCNFLLNFLSLYGYREELLSLLSESLARGLIFTSLAESFVSQLEMACFFSLLLTIPFCVYQMWAFLKPGFYGFEISFFRKIFLLSGLCYILSFLISYFVILPMAIQFLTSFESMETGFQLEFYPKISNFLSFVYKIFISSILLFQLPVMGLILYRWNWIDSDSMIANRRYFVLLSFVLAGIFSPPDIGSQLFLALPLILFYECILLFFLWMKYKKDLFCSSNEKTLIPQE